MSNDVNYQDPSGVDYQSGVDYSEPAAESSRRSGGVSIPTVLASAGVAAIISAIVVTIGVVGIVVSERGDSTSAAQPTVVNLGAAQTALPQQGIAGQQPGAVPGQPAPAGAPAGAPAAAPTENVPEGGGAIGGPVGPPGEGAAPAPAPGQAPAPAPGTTVAPQQPVAAAPTALTPGQLNTKVRIVMNANGSRAARAAELEGGERALRQIDLVSRAITTYGNVGLSYQMVGPVQVSGTTLTAPLQISVVGRGSQNRSMTFVWSGNKWKLSNRSVCAIAGFVLLPCSL
ncbi:hypothetical protein [Gordonia sp. KTR9]|uniref:hypothetical protein n=1 Tax=Gordonia sp. KTR9 TaxID=337191 RepID=UPI00027DDC92|nr:hypothetical protein [Gordonia sp. KTR9]AFR47162.1 hypothetical protein KTR9_0496 [Gordonia sp. KTR9]